MHLIATNDKVYQQQCLAKEFKDILEEKLYNLSKEKYLNVGIAGGCARDWYFNEEAVDIDVWIHSKDLDLDDSDKILSELFSFGVRVREVFKRKEGYEFVPEDFNEHLHIVIKAEYKGLCFDLIFVDRDLKTTVSDFNCSLSQIAAYFENIEYGISFRTTGLFDMSYDSEVIIFSSTCSDKYKSKIISKKHLSKFRVF